jgi:hypothetical protein
MIKISGTRTKPTRLTASYLVSMVIIVVVALPTFAQTLNTGTIRGQVADGRGYTDYNQGRPITIDEWFKLTCGLDALVPQ